MPAYVYLIEEVPIDGDSTGPWTRIGYSQNPPEWRMDANLKRGNPRDIRIAADFIYQSSHEARAAERSAQQHFSHCAYKREWFRISWNEVAAWLDSQGAIRRTPISVARP
jgi:hypothetical protein